MILFPPRMIIVPLVRVQVQSVCETKFHFAEKSSPFQYVTGIATSLQVRAPRTRSELNQGEAGEMLTFIQVLKSTDGGRPGYRYRLERRQQSFLSRYDHSESQFST